MSTKLFWEILHFLSDTTPKARRQEMLRLLGEISRHYYTEESTRQLACGLLNNDGYDFIETHLDKNPSVNWIYTALRVMLEWYDTRRNEDKTILLNAMEKSNFKAANFFRKALMCGRCLLFLRPSVSFVKWVNFCLNFPKCRFNYPLTCPVLVSYPLSPSLSHLRQDPPLRLF